MPQEHLTTVLTALFADEVVTPQTNPMIVYGAVFVLFVAAAIALWASRPFRRGLGQKLLTPRPDDADGLPWMPGGDIFGGDDEETQPTPAPARAQPTYQPAPTHHGAPTYQPEPTYRPLAGAPQFNNAPPQSAPPQTRPAPPRNPWSTS